MAVKVSGELSDLGVTLNDAYVRIEHIDYSAMDKRCSIVVSVRGKAGKPVTHNIPIHLQTSQDINEYLGPALTKIYNELVKPALEQAIQEGKFEDV